MSKRQMYAKKNATRKLYLTYFLYICKGLTIEETAQSVGHSYTRVENGLYTLRKIYGAKSNMHLLAMLFVDEIIKVDDSYQLILDYDIE